MPFSLIAGAKSGCCSSKRRTRFIAPCLSPCSARLSAWWTCRIAEDSAGRPVLCARTAPAPAANNAAKSRAARRRLAGETADFLSTKTTRDGLAFPLSLRHRSRSNFMKQGSDETPNRRQAAERRLPPPITLRACCAEAILRQLAKASENGLRCRVKVARVVAERS